MFYLIKCFVYLVIGGILGVMGFSSWAHYKNYKHKKYEEEKDLRRRGIDPKSRKFR